MCGKLLQSCLTLCDPIDGGPPGSPVPGILQARTLEWVAISFFNAWKWKVKVKSLSCVQLFTTHGLQPTRLLCPWDFPGKSTGVGCHCLLHVAGQETTKIRTTHGTKDWFKIGKEVCQNCILLPYLFNLYGEYTMWNSMLNEAQAGIKIAGRNINNFRYADNTTLVAESKEELKSFLMKLKVKKECKELV